MRRKTITRKKGQMCPFYYNYTEHTSYDYDYYEKCTIYHLKGEDCEHYKKHRHCRLQTGLIVEIKMEDFKFSDEDE